MQMQASSQDQLYAIGTLSELTGVNPVTLRAWERRYNLLQPARSDTGRRMYSEEDVHLIHKVLKHLESGMAISSAVKLVQSGDVISLPNMGIWQNYRYSFIEAIEAFNEPLLDECYNEVMSLYTISVMTDRLLVPLLQDLGDRWTDAGEVRIAEEHFFSMYMRNKLGARFHHRNALNRGPSLVASCLPGEFHEFGLLLFALSAHEHSYRIILLGANMPLEELPVVRSRTNSQGIVLSGSMSSYEEGLLVRLAELHGKAEVPVFIGGEIAQLIEEEILEMGTDPVKLGVIPMNTDVGQSVRLMRNTLSANV
jgi:DNA-binding transcriptional MerR regulator/methylmalonyl-CoA mutase cobalamin-binding subunit